MTDVLTINCLPTEVRQAILAGHDRTLCPRCAGGRTGEISLSIQVLDETSAPVVRLRCWRVSCEWRAVTIIGEAKLQAKVTKARPYRQPVYPLSTDACDFLSSTYGLSPKSMLGHGWTSSEDPDEIVLPIRSPLGEVRGHITRTLRAKPKRVYTYKTTAQSFLDWWPASRSNPVIVVEDCLSACRLHGLGFQAVALLGTNISNRDAREIAEVSRGAPVVLALDRDAFAKALKWRNRHAGVVNLLPVCLTDDIKDMPDDESIRTLFTGRQNGRKAVGISTHSEAR